MGLGLSSLRGGISTSSEHLRRQESLTLKTNSSHWEQNGHPGLAVGIIFSLQTLVGILGNVSLLLHYLILYFTGCKCRSTDLFIKHLTVANVLVILSRGVPHTMAALGMKHFLDDIRCKLVFYVHRVSRDVSIGSTCLLSVFQAITISPRHSRWMELKVKAPKYVGPSNILCWILNMALNAVVPVYMTSNRSGKNLTQKNYIYCSARTEEKTANSLYVALVFFRDALHLVLMLGASCSMLSILYRHKQEVQYIHRNNLSPSSSPESRAMQSILVLVSIFASLCTLSFIFHVCSAVLRNPSVWLMNTSVLIAGSFPTVSPYVLMSYDSRISWLCFDWIRDTKPSKLIIDAEQRTDAPTSTSIQQSSGILTIGTSQEREMKNHQIKKGEVQLSVDSIGRSKPHLSTYRMDSDSGSAAKMRLY
ncbi:vomeronasal type-1 receptor 4-like [Lepus europaeus]|uniref:vomeronasal type-1 receptor 4-like n=1 Tax=Lepus europaeus TaxID=9983 RepID=UPI002B47FFD1|nr:vomeronasal type-1 receptor 4-like [Lepus europaeus]